ncbi:O-antigen translocase [Sphingomonas sp. TF3]|nr:O-antigen translocase [Sphingomonas sp. TF3]
MSLIRTSALNGVAVVVRTATAMGLNKVLAVLVGPAGYALIGQFQNLLTVVITFATGAVNTGVTKATAEYHDDPERRRRLWRTSATTVLLASCLVALVTAAFSRQLAASFLGDVRYATVLIWVAISIVPISFNALLLAILNGLKDVRRYVISNIAGSLLSLVVTGALAWFYGLLGALIALSVNQGIVVVVTLLQVRRCDWFEPRAWIGAIDRRELRGLGGYVLMAATTALVGPASQLLVRDLLIKRFGMAHAGYWDAMWRISTIYLSLITTTLSLYYLPRIAELRDWLELRLELRRVLQLVVPATAFLSVMLFLTRDIVVSLLFSDSFGPMKTLFAWQLSGDVIKITAWLFAFLMIGRGLVVAFILTEIMAGVVFVLATMVLTSWIGFPGVAAAHFLNYAVYLIVVAMLTVGTPARRARLLRRSPQ